MAQPRHSTRARSARLRQQYRHDQDVIVIAPFRATKQSLPLHETLAPLPSVRRCNKRQRALLESPGRNRQSTHDHGTADDFSREEKLTGRTRLAQEGSHGAVICTGKRTTEHCPRTQYEQQWWIRLQKHAQNPESRVSHTDDSHRTPSLLPQSKQPHVNDRQKGHPCRGMCS